MEATVDGSEDPVRDYCLGMGAPAFENSVWFALELPAGFPAPISVDTTGSDYSSGIAVLADFGDGASVVGCAPGRYVSPIAPPAGTYYIAAFGDSFSTPQTGGMLNLVVEQAPLPPCR